ncbi:hypothetical protein BDW02DRAFT_584548, partial [Decorospora gaudefroyi]
MPPGIPRDASDEVLPLLDPTSEGRPYQAYCETVTSSRPPSPQSLIPRPLCISPKPSAQILFDAHAPKPHESEQNRSLVLSAASSPGSYVDSATLLKTGRNSKSQTQSPNRKLFPKSTVSANSVHITRAVFPRGSHSLAPTRVIAYHQALSHPRVQQLDFVDSGTAQTISRKPVQQHDANVGTNSRPLPPLPLEPVVIEDEYTEMGAQEEATNHDENRQHFAQTATSIGREEELGRIKSLVRKASEDGIQPRQLPSPSKYNNPRLKVTFEDEVPSPVLAALPYNAYFRDLSISRQHNVRDNPAQFPSAAKLYEPRGYWSDIEDDRQARRRTQPKDANLKYQFGQLPSRGIHMPQPPPHRDAYRQQVDHSRPPPAHPPTDLQTGPRLPPWGSYADLEMQRRQRGNARERAQARAYCLTTDGMATYHHSHSMDSPGKEPSRGVDEYRQQIL